MIVEDDVSIVPMTTVHCLIALHAVCCQMKHTIRLSCSDKCDAKHSLEKVLENGVRHICFLVKMITFTFLFCAESVKSHELALDQFKQVGLHFCSK